MMEVFLKDISKIAAGNSAPKKNEFSNEGIPFVRAGSLAFLTKYESLDKCEKVSKSTALKKRLKLFKKGSILFAKSGMSSKMGRIYQLEDDAFVVSHLAIIEVDEEKANPSFIKYFFILKPPFFLIRDDAYPSIKLEDIKNITLNLPDLPTQNKIVSLLDKASALVQKREKSIVQLDELLRAQFLEMFGDPVLNPKGWESKTIENLCNVQGGLTISQHKRKNYPYEIPYLRVANVFRGSIDLSEIKKIKVTEKEIERVQLKTNDILVVEGHGNIEEIGRVAIWLKSELKMLHQNHLIRLRVKVDFLKVNYFVQYLNSDGGKYKMKAISNSTSGLNTISTGKVKSIEIPIPPIELQNQFETIYQNIQAQKETLTQSKIELENLYNALLQRAFSGQLNFNVDAELDVLLAAIDLEKEENDIRDIATVYVSRLLERLEAQEFENQAQYQQAKQVVFQMLKEGNLEQEYDSETEAVKMKLV